MSITPDRQPGQTTKRQSVSPPRARPARRHPSAERPDRITPPAPKKIDPCPSKLVYRYYGEDDKPRKTGSTVTIAPPPVVMRPYPEGRLNERYHVNKAAQAASKYDQLFILAKDKYLSGATANIPKAALRHDGGREWVRRHIAAFGAANPVLHQTTPERGAICPHQAQWHMDNRLTRSDKPKGRPTTASAPIMETAGIRDYVYKVPQQ